MSTFDPATFLDMTVNDANSTQLSPVPEGEYAGVLSSPEIKQWNSRDGTKSGLKLEMKLKLDDEGLRQLLGRQDITVRYDIMLDMTESGGLDMGKGKNVSLGRLREATGLNDPGKPFSFRMLDGKAVKARIAHRTDGEQVYTDVKAVTKLV